MPERFKKPCTYPGCRILVTDGKPRCEQHRQQWTRKADAPERMRGRALQEARARLFKRSPLCVECERSGRVAAATQRDHVVPLGEGGLDVESNTQGLCETCHDVKSKAERLRALRA